MQHVDALSRRDSVLLVHDDLTERIKRAQERDEALKIIAALLEKGPHESYKICNGIFYKEVEESDKLVIPSRMQRELIRRAHEEGHFAVKKTVEVLQRQYYWSTMAKSVRIIVDNCITCIVGNKKQGKAEGFLNPVPKEGAPLKVFHTDHIGPLKSTSKNYNHVLSVIDGFTK